jgi:hypothetical protein
MALYMCGLYIQSRRGPQIIKERKEKELSFDTSEIHDRLWFVLKGGHTDLFRIESDPNIFYDVILLPTDANKEKHFEFTVNEGDSIYKAPGSDTVMVIHNGVKLFFYDPYRKDEKEEK